MSGTRVWRNAHKYHFGTRGLRADDLRFIQGIIEAYSAQASYNSGDFKFTSAHNLIEYCEKHGCSSLSIQGRISPPDGPFFFLSIIGAVSSWEVEIPEEKSPANLAIARQMFLEIKERLATRRRFMPELPWRAARNSIVWVPLLLLTIKVLFPSLPLGEATIFGVSLSVAFIHFSLAWVERRRWYQRALVGSTSVWMRLLNKWPEISLVMLGAALSAVFTHGLDALAEVLKADF